MSPEDSHLSDQDLLLAVDGELSQHDAERVETHLAACWTCRVRKQEMESAIAEFVHFEQQNLDPKILPADGPRALLKAQLAELAAPRRSVHWQLSWLATAAALLVIGIGIGFLARAWSERHPPSLVAVIVPNPNLTPGATVLRSQRDICMEALANNKAVSPDLRRLVFAEYGLGSAPPRAYEVDYLITPALGGADDIRNLWPQSNSATVWNAQVKDALEEHLRGLVCDGQLDLTTAQRDLAGNWIEAYKKYFHTDQPLGRIRQ
jgi:hypothetical protein